MNLLELTYDAQPLENKSGSLTDFWPLDWAQWEEGAQAYLLSRIIHQHLVAQLERTRAHLEQFYNCNEQRPGPGQVPHDTRLDIVLIHGDSGQKLILNYPPFLDIW